MKVTHFPARAVLASVVCLLLAVADPCLAQPGSQLDINNLEPVNVKLEKVKYLNKDAIRVTQTKGVNGEALAIIKNVQFINGTIELELSGKPLPGADTTSRGFVGLAFRVLKKDTLQYECFYLRPTNGRSSDQLRRNHATQYVSEPQYPWFRLRKENPGAYESYVDLVVGEWTKVKIEVSGQRAKLYVHDSPQPSLVINDVKHKAETGQIALWIGNGTEGHFRNLSVKQVER